MVKRKKIILLSSLIIASVITTSTILVLNAKDETIDETNLPSFNNTTEYFFSNKYTSMESNQIVESRYKVEDEDILISENNNCKFYINKQDLSIRYVEDDGYVHSTTVNRKNKEGKNALNTLNYNIARSAINIYYYDYKNNNMTLQLESMNVIEDADEDNIIVNNKSKLLSFEFDSDHQGFKAKYFFATSGITIPFNVRINERSFTVSIDDKEIEEGNDYKLGAISLYSYFGGVNSNEIDGYNFIPDGTGALIRYKQTSDNTYSNYSKMIYGQDIALQTSSTNNDSISIMLPVFGYVHGVNQHGMVSYIQKGAEYGSINATQSSKNRPFYQIYPQFFYRNTYSQPMSSTGSSISLIQENRENFDIEITYEFLKGNEANYVGMANAYKKYLFGNKEKTSSTFQDIPLRVDSIGLEVTKGTLLNKKIVMSTFKEYSDIIQNIHNMGINNTFGVFKGFSENGVTWASPNYKKVSNKLGSIEDNEFNESTYYYLNTLLASEKGKGYSTSKDVARKINSTLISNTVNGDLKYYLTAKSASNILNKNLTSLKEKNINNYALDDLGSTLYSSYAKNSISRKEAKETIIETLSNMENSPLLYQAFDYALPYTNKNLDYSMFSSQYLVFDDTVPFYSIVVSGYVSLYSKYINFFSNARDDLLRMIDYNVYPSFLLTKQKASKLDETSLNYIYSSAADDYQEEVKVYYNFVNDALKNVINASIISRTIIEDGVVLTSYDNGVSIIVNYQNHDVIYQGMTIKYKNYQVLGGNNNE